MKKVRIGIIGIGNMGSGHCSTILKGQVPGAQLTAVADINESRRQWAKENLPETVKIFNDDFDLIKSGVCDAVLVVVPHYDHPRIVISALKNGLHVLCEKPAGVYTKQVQEMNDVAMRSDKVFAMMFNQRTDHKYRKMHELIQSGELGTIKRVNWIITDWYRTQAYYDSGDWRGTWDGEGGGVLLNQCPHQLDLLQWLCGMPTKVNAVCHEGKWHNIEVEDDVTAYLEFENGATGVFVTSTGDALGTNRLEINLTKGKLVCEGGKLSGYRLKEDERTFMYSAKHGFENPEAEKLTIETDGESPQHAGVMKAFVDRILHGTDLVAEGMEGINGLRLSNAIHLSSWLKREIEIPFDEDLFLDELNKRRASSRRKTSSTNVTFSVEGTF
ncbi:MAG: Gfo/Idh/MocA family oxidoreductase [Staphylococcus equorum]|nr:Gfo/Idh/MocA family oxidoreductase [Staphylococcus equorum]